MAEMTEEDFLNLSDEEMLQMMVPPRIGSGEEEAQEQEQEEQDAELAETDAGESTEDGSTESGAEAGFAEDAGTDAGEEDTGAEDLGDDEFVKGGSKPAEKPAAAAGAETRTEAETETGKGTEAEKPAEGVSQEEAGSTSEPDYKGFYEQMMKPFRANGKEIKLESPEEAVRLMQMGANYTKKLMALQPNLKLMRMLEDAKLLDEGKLSFLIDIQNKNPQAIAKLLKDGNIDPLDLDTREENAYTPKSYAVSDQEHNFRTVLDDVVSTQEGKSVVTLINQTWDEASKKRLWEDPEILRVMLEHKQSGAYDEIAGEVSRRQMVGKLPTTLPFIQAYQQVGTELAQRAQQSRTPAAQGNPAADLKPPTTAQTPAAANQKQVLEVRAASPKKAAVAVDPRVKAAMPSRSGSPAKRDADFDPMNLSDEEFLKLNPLRQRV